MGVKAALDALKNTGIDPDDDRRRPMRRRRMEGISADDLGALHPGPRSAPKNAWGIDVQNRCCTTVSAMKIARDMLVADDDIRHRDGRRRLPQRRLCRLRRQRHVDDVQSRRGRRRDHPEKEPWPQQPTRQPRHRRRIARPYRRRRNRRHLQSDHQRQLSKKRRNRFVCMDPVAMKNRLNEVSMPNWYKCIDESLRKSGLSARRHRLSRRSSTSSAAVTIDGLADLRTAIRTTDHLS
ncbi:MAG: hypothetical protein MZU97_24225 [Bacillus subtilis]|nr:hypothetical protein [Bacillus subtilis]